LRAGTPAYDDVATNGLIDEFAHADDLLQRAQALLAAGLRTLKIKLASRTNAAFAAEAAALRKLVSKLPGDVEIRIDANEAWALGEARARFEALAEARPSFVEQPVAADALADLGRCAVPWAADESLRIAGMPDRLLDADGCAAFVIKPTLHGMLRAYDLGRAAQARGLDVVVTHCFDGAVATAAAAELALALPLRPRACGLDADWAIRQLRDRGFIKPSGRSGLGFCEDAR